MKIDFNPENRPRRILLVDDEIDLLELLGAVLRNVGYKVQCAENGAKGLEYFRRGEWDAVIIDRAMPEMNGEELAEAIKASSPMVPLIMITGMRGAISRPELFDFILSKPFRTKELVDSLAGAFQMNETDCSFTNPREGKMTA